MTKKERIIHSILFEVVALIILVALATLATDEAPLTMTGLTAALSTIAMVWNYLYNIGFDKMFGPNRLSRGLWMRIGHSIGFEVGITLASFPMIMWVLELGVWQALMADLGLTVFYLIYAIIFNWSYDIIRDAMVSRKSLARNMETSAEIPS